MSLEIAFDRLAQAVEILGRSVRINFDLIEKIDVFTLKLSSMIDHLVKASDIQDKRLRILEDQLLKQQPVKEDLPN